MAELTKEFLQKSLSKLATKQDLKDIRQVIEDRVEDLARIVNEGFEDVNDRIDHVEKKLDLSDQIKLLEQKFEKLEKALNIKL